MKISNLMCSQNSVRNLDVVEKLIRDISTGKVLTKANLIDGGPLIEIVEFGPSMLMVQNGHHRVTAMLLAGRTELNPDEFFLSKYSLFDYMAINIPTWVTPFNPLRRVRKFELGDWKQRVRAVAREQGEEAAATLIRMSPNEYSEDREFLTMDEFADQVEIELGTHSLIKNLLKK